MPQQQVSQYHSVSVDYERSDVLETSIRPRLLVTLATTVMAQAASPLRLEFLPSELQLNNGWYVGTLVPLNSFGPAAPLNSLLTYAFGLDLDYFVISQLEKFREGKDLQFRIIVRFTAEAQAPQPFSVSPQVVVPFRIPKSDWVEVYLPKLKFRDVLLLEFPRLDSPNFKETLDHLSNAWRQYGFGEYDKVLEECRKALETAKESIKKKDLVKDDEVDWKQIMRSERAADYVSNVHKNVFGYNSLGAHTGKSINREDADFALLTTHALLVLLTKKIK